MRQYSLCPLQLAMHKDINKADGYLFFHLRISLTNELSGDEVTIRKTTSSQDPPSNCRSNKLWHLSTADECLQGLELPLAGTL